MTSRQGLRSSARLAALVAALAAALALGACGGGLPDDTVAKVGDQSIKRSTFDHWMRVIAISASGQQGAGTAPKVQVPDAPEFKRCIADKRTNAKPQQGQPEQTDDQLKQQCKSEYEGYRDEVMSFLIRSTWLDQEAAEQGVKVASKDVEKQLADARAQAQLTEEDAWQKFLVGSGLTTADVLFQQRGSLLESKVADKVTKGTDKVTDVQISDYYEKHKAEFAQPERRDVRVVLAKSKADAEKARAALESGDSWKAVARKYSTDPSSKDNGGLLEGVTQGQQEEELGKAVFAAPKGQLSEPLESQFGWYVFEVVKVVASVQQSLADSKDAIREQIVRERSDKALEAFSNAYRKRWKALTECRDGFVVDDCDNAKSGGSTSTVPPGAQTTPGQAPAPTATAPATQAPTATEPTG